ncbi:hypothetical protein SALB_08554 [Streptomyces noursei]|uniref:Uncharacterized protein n=1 Tax=Streptomyces noursei TaxID=1971 RepID=A0A401RDQ2_STRNR|nr:hypothetical protein SALB_08554 [Streptomyces noursei]
MEQEEFIGQEQNSHQQWAQIFEQELAEAKSAVNSRERATSRRWRA